MDKIKSGGNEIYDNYLTSIVNLTDIGAGLSHMFISQKSHIIAPNEKVMLQLEGQITQALENIQGSLEAFATTLDEGEETEAFNVFTDKINTLLSINEKILNLSRSNNDDIADQISSGKFSKLFTEINELYNVMLLTNTDGAKLYYEQNQKTFENSFWLMVMVFMIAMAAICLVWLVLKTTVVKPVQGMTGVMKELADGNFDVEIPAVGQRDEIGQMAQTVQVFKENALETKRLQEEELNRQKEEEINLQEEQRMAEERQKEEQRIIEEREQEEQRIAAENLRIKIALDNCQANVMVADNEFVVIYCNDAVLRMLQLAEADIRMALPNFSADKVIGTCIDVFHKNPAHQRQMVNGLTSGYDTSIKVGVRTFDLIANPINDEDGNRLGTVVEWKDLTQQLTVEDEIDVVVKASVAGDFTQQVDPEGKEGFMLTLAEAMNKLSETSRDATDDVGTMLSALASGDLTNRITADYEGAFLRLKDDSNKTAEQLTNIVGEIITVATEIESGATEIRSGSDNLSSRTEQQAAVLEETASSMETLNSKVDQNVENATQATQFARSSREVAEQGGRPSS